MRGWQRIGSPVIRAFCTRLRLLMTAFVLVVTAGCVSDEVKDYGLISSYQQMLTELGPQRRADREGRDPNEPLGLLTPVPTPASTEIEVTIDPNSGKHSYSLSIEEAIVRTLVSSPEIRVVSFDPSIAKEEITRAAAEFDPTAFGRTNYEKEDNPVNSIFQPGQSNARLLEAGIRQKTVLGSEWSLSYALTRGWDDLVGRTLATRYEPILVFAVRQPLLRNAWEAVNLAGVNIARLNHEIALVGFRQKAEEISTQTIAAYWQLSQTRRDLEIQQSLLNETTETLQKVLGRKEIDATDVQIKQTEASLKSREAVLIHVKKIVIDTQDALVRLMADPQMNLLSEAEIVPITTPDLAMTELNREELLRLAMNYNPAIQQARLAIAIADINIEFAKSQRMPRLDLVASSGFHGLDKSRGDSHDNMEDFASYALGFSLEFPLGNRQRQAELMRRKLERSRAVSALQNTADKVAAVVKERIRRVETNHTEIQIQKDAVEAAGTHLHALEETESVREKLTPEFLLVKLQAQEALAQAQRAEVRAIVEFNISTAELAQATGTVLKLHQVSAGSPVRSIDESISDQEIEAEQKEPNSAAEQK